jgi:hypothetical protein
VQSCCISGIKEKAHNIFDGDKEIGVLVFQCLLLKNQTGTLNYLSRLGLINKKRRAINFGSRGIINYD